MSPTPRILHIDRRSWLPPFVAGRLLVGSASTADARLEGLLPFHALVEARKEAVVLHDLARRGDVRDGQGRPVPETGARIESEERFHVGPHALAVFVEEGSVTAGFDASAASARACAICGAGHDLVSGQGRTVGSLFVCLGCLGVVDVDPACVPGHEIVARLGSGGMATVYLAVATATGEPRALKVFEGKRGADRFEREARVLLRLVHPNVVRVLDAGSAGGILWLACELVVQGDALARLAKRGIFEPAAAARLGADVAAALVYAHAQGVVHRDVKPSNVLLADDGSAKLADFGLAKELAALGGQGTTSTGTTLGTIAYAAPEQLRDARSAGPPADVFGLAATLFHLLAGQPPRRVAPGTRRATEPAPGLAALAPGLAPALLALVERGLSPRPEDRPLPRELEAALRALAR